MLKTEAEFELTDEAKSYIPIDNDTRLAITARNWQLQKRNVAITGKKAGEITWATFRYYTSLESALKDIVHIKTAQESFRSAQGLLEANARVISEISKAFSPQYEIREVTDSSFASIDKSTIPFLEAKQRDRS